MPGHLFVYGTLRAGSAHPMAHRLRVGARLIGKGSVPGLLYDFGSWPGAFFGPEEKYRVIGNVFALGRSSRLLTDLDKYEGVTPANGEEREFPEAEGLFHRIAIEVSLEKGGSVEAWAYALKEAPRARLIGTGDFLADRRMRAPKAARP
ncbi:MAG TPA: gamma-glutamylcyclotransferase family protein [Methyloceanibacter sp.]